MGDGWKRDAVDWYVEIESGRELRDLELSQWNHWSDSPRSRAEYAQVADMVLALRELPPPSPASRNELRGDLKGLGSV